MTCDYGENDYSYSGNVNSVHSFNHSLTHLCVVGMSAKHRSALRSARTTLLKSVHMSERLLSELISMSVIGLSLKEEIDVSNRWFSGYVMVRHGVHNQELVGCKCNIT